MSGASPGRTGGHRAGSGLFKAWHGPQATGFASARPTGSACGLCLYGQSGWETFFSLKKRGMHGKFDSRIDETHQFHFTECVQGYFGETHWSNLLLATVFVEKGKPNENLQCRNKPWLRPDTDWCPLGHAWLGHVVCERAMFLVACSARACPASPYTSYAVKSAIIFRCWLISTIESFTSIHTIITVSGSGWTWHQFAWISDSDRIEGPRLIAPAV